MDRRSASVTDRDERDKGQDDAFDRALLLLLVPLLLAACAACTPSRPPASGASPAVPVPTAACPPVIERSGGKDAIPAYTYRVVRVYPHDPAAFTQGLAFHDGALYESTGLVGRSSLRRVALQTGRPMQVRPLPEPHFGEGIAVTGDLIVQLTWKSHLGFLYDRDTFEVVRTFPYPTEGWGLAWDGARLIMSDGTATLYFLDPQSLEMTGQVEVRDDEGPVARLNELEYICGEVWANVWQTDRIARIDPGRGRVVGWIDLAGLLDKEERSHTDVLNGIAYDAGSGRLLVTGKLWPRLFQIEVVPERGEGAWRGGQVSGMGGGSF